MTSSVAGLRRSSEVFPTAKLAPKRLWSPCGGLLPVWPTTNWILNTGEAITSERYAQQIDEIHRKLQCLQLALVNRMGPILLHDYAQSHQLLPILFFYIYLFICLCIFFKRRWIQGTKNNI